MDYRKKLGLNISDEEKTARFYAQMHNYFINASSVEFDEVIETVFCNSIGVRIEEKNPLFDDVFTTPSGLARAWSYLKQYETNLEELIFCYVELINSYPKNKKAIKNGLKDILLNALDDCQIKYEILNDADGVFIFPQGAKELDDALVSEPLEWLSAYPKAHAAFVKALKEYADAIPDNASDIADKFRKTLETFFQEFFGFDKTLENCKGLYGDYLKNQNVPTEITGNFETLLQAYTNFMNGYAKHHDKTSMNVLEYIMYQTGNIIRLLITLKQEETGNAD